MKLPPHELDHLVVAARTLEQGLAWCDATFGLRPHAGGQHVFMGTHNRVFSISSPAFPRAYLEVIAIDPSLPAPERPRWFDLDDTALQAQLAAAPRLVHWAARVDDIEAACAALAAEGIDVGRVTDAERGALRWRISVRDDGRRACGGAAPALIEWRGAHPTDALAASGVRLLSMAIEPQRVAVELHGLRGRVTLAASSTLNPSSETDRPCTSTTN